MALPDTQISTALVGQTLETSSRSVGSLCTHASVNRWSKRKPIKHTSLVALTEAQFAAARYGIHIPELLSTVGTAYNNANWNYNKPTSLDPKRLGDFRFYEHSAPVPLLQNHGTGEIVFAKFVQVNQNIMFDILRSPTAIAQYCLNIENISPEGGSPVAGNYYLAADIYPRGATSGNPLLTIYSLNKIGYSQGTYNEDARSIRLSEPSLPAGNYAYHLYMSTHNETVPTGELRKNYTINWVSAFPNKINMSVKSLASQFTVEFAGIKPGSGSWPDGTTGWKTGMLSNNGLGNSSDFGTLRYFIARFKITNYTGRTVYIPRDELRVNYDYQNAWTDPETTNTYGSIESGSNVVISNGATVYINTVSLRLFPTAVPTGSVDVTVFPNFKLFYFNSAAPVGEGYEPFYHNPGEPTVALNYTN